MLSVPPACVQTVEAREVQPPFANVAVIFGVSALLAPPAIRTRPSLSIAVAWSPRTPGNVVISCGAQPLVAGSNRSAVAVPVLFQSDHPPVTRTVPSRNSVPAATYRG